MALFGKPARMTWDRFKLSEHIVMMAMTVEPQRDVEWLIQRALCFHGVAEITTKGLRLTHLGRMIIAERHGLPVVVGRDPAAAALATNLG